MTWSIIARDRATGRIGIAVATCAFAVGARVPHIRTGVGAIATQAMTNVMFGPRGLELLAAGVAADACLSLLLEADAGRSHRRVHAMDAEGRFAARTGAHRCARIGRVGRRLSWSWSANGMDRAKTVFKGHFNWAGSVAMSLDGSRIVNFAPDRIRVSTSSPLQSPVH